MILGGLVGDYRERLDDFKRRTISQALEPDAEKQREELKTRVEELRKAKGTDIRYILGEDTELFLRFLKKMSAQSMPGSEELPTSVRKVAPVTTITTKKLFKPVINEVLFYEIEDQDHVRGYPIGATGIGPEPDGENRMGEFYFNPGPAIYGCEDRTARQSAMAQLSTQAGVRVKGFPFDTDIYSRVEGVSEFHQGDVDLAPQAPGDFRSGYFTPIKETAAAHFYPKPLEQVLDGIASRHLPPAG